MDDNGSKRKMCRKLDGKSVQHLIAGCTAAVKEKYMSL
jgi:hypothetical protein